MSQGLIITLTIKTLYLIIFLSLPMILVAMSIGFAISIFQATTQIQEQTLSFVPKSMSVFFVIFIVAPGHLKQILSHTIYLISNIPSFLAEYPFLTGIPHY